MGQIDPGQSHDQPCVLFLPDGFDVGGFCRLMKYRLMISRLFLALTTIGFSLGIGFAFGHSYNLARKADQALEGIG